MKVDRSTGEVAMTWRDRRAIVLHRAAFTCEECFAAPATEVDHIWPKSWGGKDDLNNLRGTCLPCNRSKGGTAYVKDITYQRARWTRDLKMRRAVDALVAAARWNIVSKLVVEVDADQAWEQSDSAVSTLSAIGAAHAFLEETSEAYRVAHSEVAIAAPTDDELTVEERADRDADVGSAVMSIFGTMFGGVEPGGEQ